MMGLNQCITGIWNNKMNKKNRDLAINGGIPVSKQHIPIHIPYLDEDDFAAVDSAVRSTFVSGDGPKCREFEKNLAEYLNVKHVLFVNSATSALELAFRVKNFPDGSEVIIPNFTYTSSALGPLYNNLKIVLADVYPDNGSLDINKLESYISPKTVAVVPVDYGGIPAEMNKIMTIAKIYNLYVVHDTAQSIGSVYKGKKTGLFGDVSTFSFHGTKNLTTGEGGALVTQDDEIAERVKILREKGTNKYSFLANCKDRGYYEYVDTGMSYVQSNINGALGVSQLKKLEFMNQERKTIAEYYKKELNDVPYLNFMRITDGSEHNWHLFGILVPAEYKYWIMDALRAEGIMANVHYTPLHLNKFYSNLATDKQMSGSIQFFESFLRLPIYPSLNEEERFLVTSAVKKVLNS